MIGYSYNDKGIYISTITLRKDPLEKNRYLIPRNCTLIQAPEYGENQIPVFNGTEWEIKEDYRGKIIYNIETKESQKIKEIGPVPEGWTLEKPFEFSKWDSENNTWVLDEKQVKNYKLSELKNIFTDKITKTTIHSQTIDKDIDAGTVALTNINGLLDILENDDDTVEFRLADNSFTTVTRTQLVEMKKEIIQVGQQLYKNKWAIEEQINNETDIEKLKNSVIDLDNGMLVYTEPKGEE